MTAGPATTLDKRGAAGESRPRPETRDIRGSGGADALAAPSDGGVFATSGARNPTLTIMAVALRSARYCA
jgi:hypothetical protein